MGDPLAATSGGPGPLVVPAMPPLPDDLVARRSIAHTELAERLRAASPASRAVTLHLCRRLLVESLANLQPTWIEPRRPQLVPAPRAFLDERLTTRRRGAAEAYRYLSGRLAMVRTGAVTDVVDHAVPEVVNALVQAAPRSTSAQDETNPGLVRATPTWWRPEVSPFAHPAPEQCRHLLHASIELARTAPAPAIARAGWLAFMVNTIHPFVDGNGRTHRALALGLASSGQTATDWGLLEQWALDRPAYVEALALGHGADRYSPSELDPAPFMRHTVVCSQRGARLTLERLGFVDGLLAALVGRGLTAPAATVVALLIVDRFMRLGELVDALEQGRPGGTLPDVDDHRLVMALVRSGVLRWADPPPGRPSGRGLVPGDPVADLVERCADARWDVPSSCGHSPVVPR